MSVVAFIHRPAKLGQSRVEVVARGPALHIAIEVDGEIVVHVASESVEQAAGLLDVLEARADIGDAVRVLVERATDGRDGEAA